jgi:hypothetical protein
MKTSNLLLIVAASILLFASVSVQPAPKVSTTYVAASQELPTPIPEVDEPTPRLSSSQKLLAMAYEVAVADGHHHPELLQGIIMQESRAGDSHLLHRSARSAKGPNYGVAQVQLKTAREVLKRNPDLWSRFNFSSKSDREIVAKLVENDRFNVTIASRYLLIIKGLGFKTMSQMAVAYNLGPGGAKKAGASTPYSRSVLRHVNQLAMN